MRRDELIVTPDRVAFRGLVVSWSIAPHEVRRVRAGFDHLGFESLAVVGRGVALVRVRRDAVADDPLLRQALLEFVARVPVGVVTASAAELLEQFRGWGHDRVPPQPVPAVPFW